MSTTVYILSAARTPVGRFQGELSTVPPTQLGTTAISAALEKAQIPADSVEECIMGQVLTAGVGQAPARQAALGAGIPNSASCLTINKVCGSGLMAVQLAADSLQLKRCQIAVAGGQETMSLAPHLMENSRAGYRMGNVQVTDSMIKDGLWDPYNNFHMGNAAELCTKKYKMSRKEQDQFAKESYEKALDAQKSGLFQEEITPVKVKVRKSEILVDTDEEPGKAKFDKMPTLRPAFDKEGTITAANASKINDGAAAVVLASEEKVKELGSQPLAKIVTSVVHSQDPQWFTTAPIEAIKKSLKQASLTLEDIDLFEINEAFSCVTLAAMKDLGIPREKVNVHGGAVAIGHPIGASGARILTTLLYALKNKAQKRGLATLCIGGGEAISMIVERL